MERAAETDHAAPAHPHPVVVTALIVSIQGIGFVLVSQAGVGQAREQTEAELVSAERVFARLLDLKREQRCRRPTFSLPIMHGATRSPRRTPLLRRRRCAAMPRASAPTWRCWSDPIDASSRTQSTLGGAAGRSHLPR
ncbi:MAG: hypothetical protein OHK0044_20210 [Burkholderiaceae bacterium]